MKMWFDEVAKDTQYKTEQSVKQLLASGCWEKLTIIDLPGFNFEKSHPNATEIEPLLDKVRRLLDKKESIGANTRVAPISQPVLAN